LKKGVLIYNPVAGRRPAARQRIVREAARVLLKSGLNVELAPTTGPAMAHTLAEAAVGNGMDVVLACGGDGTINEVINGLAHSNVPLGILPAGTANIVARELRLPLNPVRAARQFPQWIPRRIALGHARWGPALNTNKAGSSAAENCSRHYISVAGVGYDAEVVYKLSSWMKFKFGVAGYVMEALRQWAGYSFPRFSWRYNGEDHQSTFAVIHRTKLYAGWLHLAPTAGLFQRHFAVCSFPSRSRLRYLHYAVAVLLRQHLHVKGVALNQCDEVNCQPLDAGPIRFELDGELAGEIPAKFEIVPEALTLLVPKSGGE
jgi:diacylglycerol kinase (ATP)